MTVKNENGQTALDIAKGKNDKKIYRMIYEKMIESLSSKASYNKCAKDDCQQEIKRLMFDKVGETLSFREAKTCVVCFDERKGTFVLIPCGHAKTCQKCSDKIVAESKSCPLCRETVSKYQKVYD